MLELRKTLPLFDAARATAASPSQVEASFTPFRQERRSASCSAHTAHPGRAHERGPLMPYSCQGAGSRDRRAAFRLASRTDDAWVST